MSPENGSVDNVLIGTRSVSKHAASGWWNLNTVDITDPVGNERFENPNTLGCALYVNNPLEDLAPPLYIDDSYALSLTTVDMANPVTGESEMQALRVQFDTFDKSPLARGLSRVTFPANAEGEQRTIDIQSNTFPSNGYDEVKEHDMNLPIPHFYPTGEYVVNWAIADDIALNTSSLYLTEDVTNSNANGFDIFAEDRETVYIETSHPDILPPMVDLNSISISASPTNPDAPNGETLVTIECLIQDTSDFDEFAAGLKYVAYTFAQPHRRGIHLLRLGRPRRLQLLLLHVCAGCDQRLEDGDASAPVARRVGAWDLGVGAHAIDGPRPQRPEPRLRGDHPLRNQRRA